MHQRFDLPDGWLSYERFGGGRPLLCLHGGMGLDAATLRVSAFRALGSAGCDVVIHDQRGHGASSRLPEDRYSHALWVDDARRLTAHLGWNSHAVLGHSYGGFLALELALRHPGDLTHLILVGTSPGPICTGPLPPVPDDTSLRAHTASLWPGFFAGPEKHWDLFGAITFSAEPFRAAFVRELPRYDLRGRIRQLALPVLLLVGDGDPYRPSMQWLYEQLPEAELHVFKDAGHFPFLEAPGEFVRVVADFLGGT